MTMMIIFVGAFAFASFLGVRFLFSSHRSHLVGPGPGRTAPGRSGAGNAQTASTSIQGIEAIGRIVDRRAMSGLSAMQLLGEVHEIAEDRFGGMTSSQLLIRWAEVRTRLLDNDYEKVLIADLSRHLEIAMTYLDLGVDTICDPDAVTGDAVSRMAEHICRQSPILVGRLARQLDSPPSVRNITT